MILNGGVHVPFKVQNVRSEPTTDSSCSSKKGSAAGLGSQANRLTEPLKTQSFIRANEWTIGNWLSAGAVPIAFTLGFEFASEAGTIPSGR